MKILYTRVGTKAALNAQRKSIFTSRKRTRNIIWFNPPFCQTVKTYVAEKFLRLLDKHSPKSYLLHKIFNRNSVKVSYSYLNFDLQIIKQHNKNVAIKKEKQTNSCNCRNKTQTFKQHANLELAEGN